MNGPAVTPLSRATGSRRLAIIGGGSSGLICLKHALEALPGWEIVCFEKSGAITGCWGNPYPGFVSTSTKYTTQFACFPEYAATVHDDRGVSRAEFFCDDEYGQYLERFATKFGLRPHLRLHCSVETVRREVQVSGWWLTFNNRAAGDEQSTEHFDRVIICTGLAAEPKPIACDIPQLSVAELNSSHGLGHVTDRRIVVIGGGESAVDFANRLSRSELRNKVYLSLSSGVRISPRYHPIRGVPSDFLRNRLMLSIHESMRNRIGQRFVELRIKYQEQFERFFPGAKRDDEPELAALRKDWAYRLTKAAKDDLFNMFHNKSDDFLNTVAAGRISIIGPAIDDGFATYRAFDSQGHIAANPDLIVPAIGYQATLANLSQGSLRLSDFYLGCCHVTYPDLFLVGFARPIIGNIPTISEMQAKYVCEIIAGNVKRESRIEELHRANVNANRLRFAKLNHEAVYPVEMFPYCDQLARQMNLYPSLRRIGSLVTWCRMQLAPATTLHYFVDQPEVRQQLAKAPIYMPAALIVFLLGLKPFDAVLRIWRRLFASKGTDKKR